MKRRKGFIFFDASSNLVGITGPVTGLAGWTFVNSSCENVLPLPREVTSTLVACGNPYVDGFHGGLSLGALVMHVQVAELWLSNAAKSKSYTWLRYAKSGDKIVLDEHARFVGEVEFEVREVNSPQEILTALWGFHKIRPLRDQIRQINEEKQFIDSLVQDSRKKVAKLEQPVVAVKGYGNGAGASSFRVAEAQKLLARYGYHSRLSSDNLGDGPSFCYGYVASNAAPEVLLAIYAIANGARNSSLEAVFGRGSNDSLRLEYVNNSDSQDNVPGTWEVKNRWQIELKSCHEQIIKARKFEF